MSAHPEATASRNCGWQRSRLFPAATGAAFLAALSLCLDASAQEIRSANGGGNWSATGTWVRIGTGGPLPQAGDHVIVTATNPVVLNTAPPALKRLEIHDALTVLDTQTYNLEASRIDIGGPSGVSANDMVPGAFDAGSTTAPFQNILRIRLTDTYLTSSYYSGVSPKENMSLVVHAGSRLQLYGRNMGAGGAPLLPWGQVSGSVPSSSVALSLAITGAPGWSNGDQIVIASTDYDMNQAEARVVASSGVGGLVTLQSATSNYHHGVIERGLVDERAEVGLLSHNIQVYSTPVFSAVVSGRQDIRAGNVMIHNNDITDLDPTIRLDFVEFYNLGWKGAKGRYPIHIHQLGRLSGVDVWVRNCSIHHCFNRAIAIHGTEGVILDHNTAYDTYGHAIYLEDRSERANSITSNLVLVTRSPTLPLDTAVNGVGDTWSVTGEHYFCFHDSQVSSYWITNTENNVVGNVAAGSDAYGFWYDVSSNGNNPPFSQNHDPCRVGFGEFAQIPVGSTSCLFSGNVAHSNKIHGFYSDTTRWLPYDPTLTIPLRTINYFDNFTGYKNRDSGIWNRGHGTHVWKYAKLADNRLGVYFGSEGGQNDGPTDSAGPTDPLNVNGLFKLFDDVILGAPSYSLQILDSSVVIGQSSNPGDVYTNPMNHWEERVGIALYDGIICAFDTAFYDFVTTSAVPVPTGQPPSSTALGSSPVLGLTHRVAAAVSSHTSVSNPILEGITYSIDPRNAIRGCTFTNCTHAVLFPNPKRPMVAGDYQVVGNQLVLNSLNNVPGLINQGAFLVDAPGSPSPSQPATNFADALDAVTLLDIDGCVPGSFAGAYLVHESPLLRPGGSTAQSLRQLSYGWPTLGTPNFYEGWALPLVFGGPGTVDDQAVAQVRLTLPALASGTSGVYKTTFSAVTRGESRDIFDQGSTIMFAGPGVDLPKVFNANILLTKPGQAEEVYYLDYPATATAPGSFSLKIQFGPAAQLPNGFRSAAFRVALPNAPTSIRGKHTYFLPQGSDLMPLVASNLAAFQSGQGVWCYNQGYLWLRMWLLDLAPFGLGLAPIHPVFSGRELTIDVS